MLTQVKSKINKYKYKQIKNIYINIYVKLLIIILYFIIRIHFHLIKFKLDSERLIYL